MSRSRIQRETIAGAYYAYVNRLADGLGVELEERWTDERMVLTREEFEVARGDSR